MTVLRAKGRRLLLCCLYAVTRVVTGASNLCVKQCYIRSVADSTLCIDATTTTVAAKLNALPCTESSSRWSFADGHLRLEGTDPALCTTNSTATEGAGAASGALAVELSRCDALPTANDLSNGANVWWLGGSAATLRWDTAGAATQSSRCLELVPGASLSVAATVELRACVVEAGSEQQGSERRRQQWELSESLTTLSPFKKVMRAFGFWGTLFALLFGFGVLMWWRKKRLILEANSPKKLYELRMEQIFREQGRDVSAVQESGVRPHRWTVVGPSGGVDPRVLAADVTQRQKFLCYALPVLLLVASILGVAFVDTKPLLQWVGDSGSVAPVLFVFIFATATVLFVPAVVLTLGAGFVFADAYGRTVGIVVGSAVVFVGATLGSVVAFALGRTLVRNTVQSMVRGWDLFRAIDRAMGKNGLKFMFLMRLSPLIPFNALNYAAGTLSITFRDYLLSCFGMLPGIVSFVFLGTGMRSMSEASQGDDQGDAVLDLVMWVAGALFAIVAVVAVSKAAKRELNMVLEEDKQYYEGLMTHERTTAYAGAEHAAPSDTKSPKPKPCNPTIPPLDSRAPDTGKPNREQPFDERPANTKAADIAPKEMWTHKLVV